MIIITPTKRMALYLQPQHKNHVIISFQEWLNQLWAIYLEQQTEEPWSLLNTWQSSLIWQKMIQKSNLNLLRPTALQRDLQLAWKYLQQWQVPLEALQTVAAQQPLSDQALFSEWANQYQIKCLENRWVDEFQLPTFLTHHLKATSAVQKKWCIYGFAKCFDDITPQIKNLHHCLRALGADISEYQPKKTTNPSITYHVYRNSHHEISAAANWALEKIKNKENSPGANFRGARRAGRRDTPSNKESIAIIVPDLKKRWLEVQRIFTATLNSNHFNCAGGLPFSEFPLIGDTFLLLKSLIKPIMLDEMSHLLRSPYWIASENYTQCAQLAALLIRAGYQKISLTVLQKFMAHVQKLDILKIDSVIAERKTIFSDILMPSEWGKALFIFFEKIQWPHGRKLNNHEVSIWERWNELLLELACLDQVLKKPVKIGKIISILQQQATQIKFQPAIEQNDSLPIQIMSITDATCMSFDHVWVAGMTTDQWPISARPNPFIPITLQRQYQIPHATPQQEYEFAKEMTEYWCGTAHEVIFSYPEREEDITYLPSVLCSFTSPLVGEVDALPRAAGEGYKSLCLFSTPYPPLRVDLSHKGRGEYSSFGKPFPDNKVQGGTQLLQAQAECPFMAYAQSRLTLKKTPSLTLGSPLIRGQLVHRLLQLIWQDIKNHDDLVQYRPEHLITLIENTTQQVITEYYTIEKKSLRPSELFLSIEKKRLIQLMTHWLENEKKRAVFTVYALEKTVELELAAMTLRLRLDRIDQLENGDYLIIDYKTKKQAALAFSDSEERLLNPQLPLYALTEHLPLAGVVFAELDARQLGFSGMIEEKHADDLPKTTSRSLKATSFHQQCLVWRTQLEALMQEFQQGWAAVAPDPKGNPCQRCDLGLLCRVNLKGTEL